MSNPIILLCNPPTPQNKTADREAAYGMGALREAGMPARPPHTLAWCAAVLDQTGWKVSGLDAVAENLGVEATLTRISTCSPDILVLLVSPQTAQSDLAFIRFLRNRFPHVRLLLVGLATRYLPSSLVKASDMVLTGEPEGAIDAACRYLLAEDKPVGVLPAHTLVPSMYNLRGNLLELNHLPRPAWEFFPVKEYPYLPIVASRGCAGGCRYCPAPLTQGPINRVRAGEQVATEMHLMYTRYGVREFCFIDPLFAVDRAQTIALCETIMQFGLPFNISWRCETRPEQLDTSLLEQMSRAGCRTIELGLESVSPQTLIATGRLPNEQAVQQYLAHIRQIVGTCRKIHIDCRLHVIAGLPGDRAGASATRAFVRAYSPNSIQAAPLTPYPGTSIFPTNQINRELSLLQNNTPSQRVARRKSKSSPWQQAFSRMSNVLFVALSRAGVA